MLTAETGWPHEEECALVTSISTAKEWPLQLRRLPKMPRGISAVSVGGGWTKFIADQHLGDGAFLTIEVVDERRLVVALHYHSAHEHIKPFQLPGVNSTIVRDCRDIEPPVEDNPQPVQASVLREVRIDERPDFQKTHMKKHESSRIVSVTPCSPKCRHPGLWQFRVFVTLASLMVRVEAQMSVWAMVIEVLFIVFARCPNCVLAYTRIGRVRRHLVHPQRPPVNMDRADN